MKTSVFQQHFLTKDEQAALFNEINLDILGQMWSGLRTTLITGLILACMVVYVEWDKIDHGLLAAWCVALVLVYSIRAATFRNFSSTVNLQNVSQWIKRFRVGVIASGLVWGLGVTAFFPYGGVLNQTFLTFILIGFIAGGLMAYVADLKSAVPFTLVGVVPYLIGSFISASELGGVIGAPLLLFLIYLMITIRRSSARARQNVEIRLTALIQAQQLKKSESQFRQVFERPLMPMLLIDEKTGVIVDANKAACEFYGYPHAQFQTMKFVQLDEVAPIPGTQVWSGEFKARHRLQSGAVRAVEVHLSPLKSGKGARVFAIILDMTQRIAAEESAHSLAFYDPLTQLANRRLLHDSINQLLAMTTRHHFHGALLFLDLDNFKTLNDTEGHEVGDQLLIEVARRLNLSVRESDLLARLGGDEFVVLCEGLSEDLAQAGVQAGVMAEKIRESLAQPYYLQRNNPMMSGVQVVHHCSASIGVTMFNGRDETIEELLRRADVAMYQAKQAGRNVVRFFDPQMQAEMMWRAQLEKELREAHKAHEFVLYYQSKIDCEGRLLGAEALLRWRHPQRGESLPQGVIQLLEETGLIVSVGKWAIRTACLQIKAWQVNVQMRDLVISVNVSARQFRQADFVEIMQQILIETGIPPANLDLELTESVLLENVDDVIAKMNAIKALGVSFSLDDFGTGYSSLQYLKRLPFDSIKIDQSFVRDLEEDANDAALIKAMIAMAKELELTVIAEGVESEAQRSFLVAHGCEVLQGFLFDKPLAAAQFEGTVALWKASQ
jgi:diguanylate cyclase (GGDEF)-like protein/PAS domain S-box-containing protein